MSGFLSSGICPSLIHAVDIKIERIDYEETFQDDIYREPVAAGGERYKDPEEVLAQIHWGVQAEIAQAPGADDETHDGHITMTVEDVEDLENGPFKKGDRIIEVDGVSYAEDPLYIEEPRPQGHYATKSLWFFFFKTRSETMGGQ